MFFWMTAAALGTSALWGLVTSLPLYERISGAAGGEGDLDRVVREAW